MPEQPTVRRADLIQILATLADQPVSAVPQRVGSMEVAWLVHQIETDTGRQLGLSDADLAAIVTVDDAVRVFNERLGDA